MGTGYHKDIEPDELIQLALTKYSNMSEDKIWDEIDPKDAQILALTTKLESTDAKFDKLLQCYQTQDNNSLKTVSNSKSQKFDQSRGVYDGPSKVFDGVQMWWCNKGHKSPRSPNGLYMPHKPEDHDKWETDRAAKRSQYNRKSSNGTKDSTSSGSNEKNRLTLSQSLDPKDLKTALATNFGINEDDASSFAEKFLEEVAKK